jgi:tetratricopeptide (TPR) repeat protein
MISWQPKKPNALKRFDLSLRAKGSIHAYHAKGDVLFALGNYARAADAYSTAADLDIKSVLPATYMERGVLAFLSGDLPETARLAP